MKITLICVGKCREKYFTDAADEYLKRLSRYAKTEIIEVRDEKTPEEASEHEEDLIRVEAKANKEYADILRSSGKMSKEIPDIQWHILATAYIHLIFEIVRHDMSRDEAAEHMQFVKDLLYPGWKMIFGL